MKRSRIYTPQTRAKGDEMMGCEHEIKRFKITEKETIEIMHAGITIEADFGPSFVALTWDTAKPFPESIKRLMLIRGISNQNMDGAGI